MMISRDRKTNNSVTTNSSQQTNHHSRGQLTDREGGSWFYCLVINGCSLLRAILIFHISVEQEQPINPPKQRWNNVEFYSDVSIWPSTHHIGTMGYFVPTRILSMIGTQKYLYRSWLASTFLNLPFQGPFHERSSISTFSPSPKIEKDGTEPS